MKDKVIYIKVDEQLKADAEKLAEQNDRNLSDYIRHLLKEKIKENPVS